MARELALFKISADDNARAQIMQFTEIFRGNVVDVSKRSVTVEVTGTDDKIEAFEQMVRPFGLDRDGPHGRDCRLARARDDLARSPWSSASAGASSWGRGSSARSSWRGARARRPWRRCRCRCRPRSTRAPRCSARAARTTSTSASSSPGATTARSPGWARRRPSRPRGPDRFAAVVADSRSLGRRVVADDPAEDPARRPARARCWWAASPSRPRAARRPEWSSFPSARLVLPEVSIARRGAEARLTVSVAVWPDDRPDEVVRRAEERLEEMRPSGMPLLDPDPVARPRVSGRGAARPLRGGGGPGRGAHPGRRAREGGAGARGAGAHPLADRRRADRRRAAHGLPRVLLLLRRARRRRPSWAPRPSCWCAARARGWGRWRWPGPPGEAPTPRWTTTSASSCGPAPRTPRSTGSWSTASSGGWSRCRCGSPRPTGRCW